MKKWILYIAAALVVIGCAIGGIAMSILNWDFTKLDTENGEWRQWQFDAAEVEKIFADDRACVPIRVEESEDNKIHVFAYTTEQLDTNAELKNGSLNILAKIKMTHLFSLNMFRGLKTLFNGIVIQLPNGYAGRVELKNGNGSITVSELNFAGDLLIADSNGSITAEEITANNLTVTNTNGSIQLEKVNVQEFLNIKNSNGSIKAETVRALSAEFRGANGRITLEEVRTENELKAGNNNGAIRIEDIFSPNILLSNGNGSIKGNIDGRKTDYRIVSNVKNGSSNLGGNADINRPYLLEAENSNGSIKIEFSDK